MLSKRKINKIKLFNNKKNFRLDKFIELALFASNGYYIRNKPIGRKFDFVTSPEISQIFGEIIGVYLVYHWKEKINSKFNLIELGPGNGTLFRDIERTARILPKFFENADVNLIEINKELRKIQKKNLNYFRQSKIRWSKALNFRSKIIELLKLKPHSIQELNQKLYFKSQSLESLFSELLEKKIISKNSNHKYYWIDE